MDQRGYAWLVVGAAAAACVFAVWMGYIQKDLPKESKGLGLKLELARSAEEAQELLKDGPLTTLNKSIKVDYGFLISYSFLNAALFLFLRGLAPAGSWLRHPAFVAVGLVLAALMLVGDAVENQQMQACIHGTLSGPFLLAVFARMKWLALGVASLLLGAAFLSLPWGPGGLLSWIVLAAYLASAFFCFQGVWLSEPELGWEPLSRTVVTFALAWILSAVRAGLSLRT
jgi:hypothetical protein